MGRAKAFRVPLTRRFPLGLTDAAYRNLRALSAATGLGNNYVLTVLLENMGKTVNKREFLRAARVLKNARADSAGE